MEESCHPDHHERRPCGELHTIIAWRQPSHGELSSEIVVYCGHDGLHKLEEDEQVSGGKATVKDYQRDDMGGKIRHTGNLHIDVRPAGELHDLAEQITPVKSQTNGFPPRFK